MIEGQVKEATAKAVGRAYEQGFRDANDEPPSGDLRDYGYKKLSRRLLREYKTDPAKALATVWDLAEQSGLASWLVDIKTNHFVSSDVAPVTDDEKLQEILDAFWRDNQMADRAREFTRQLILLGSQCFPTFVRSDDGRLRLGYIDPGEIEDVVTHPGNAMERVMVIIRKDTGGVQRAYRIVKEDDDILRVDPKTKELKVETALHPGLLVTAANIGPDRYEPFEVAKLADMGLPDYSGSVIYRTWNTLSNQPRGWSDLLQVADQIDQADLTLFALGEGEQLKTYFLIDVLVKNKSPEEIKAYSVTRKTPTPGAMNFHNENEEWKIEAPDLRQAGSIDVYVAMVKHIVASMGMPSHWFGDADNTNRASADAQNEPAVKMMKAQQMMVKKMFIQILTLVRDQAIIAGLYRPKGEPAAVDLIMPEISGRDTQRAADTFTQVTTGAMLAEEEGYMTHETAAELVAISAAELGVEYDVKTELEEVEAETAEQDEADQEKRGDTLALALDGAANGSQPPRMAMAGNDEVNK